MPKKEKYNIGIIGSTGLVGRCILKELESANININNLYLFGSKKSVGKKIKFHNKEYQVFEFNELFFNLIDIFFFASTEEISKKYIPKLINNECLIIDNSSAYRMINTVPLVIPNINFDSAKNKKLISNPNCSTIQSAYVLNLIDKKYSIKKVIYSTYQAVSGSGIDGVKDFYNNTKKVYPYNIKKTCIPKIGNKSTNNYTTEEIKMIEETKKILNKKIDIYATCVRVPVLIGHGVSIYLETKKKINSSFLFYELKKDSEIEILNDLDNNLFPTSINTLNNSKIYVGRIRIVGNNKLLLYICANNLLTGAATNAVRICKMYLDSLKT